MGDGTPNLEPTWLEARLPVQTDGRVPVYEIHPTWDHKQELVFRPDVGCHGDYVGANRVKWETKAVHALAHAKENGYVLA